MVAFATLAAHAGGARGIVFQSRRGSGSGWLSSTAAANTRYYVGPNLGAWSSSANWSATANGAGGAGVPQSGDLAFVTGATPVTVQFDATYASPLSGLTVDGSGGTVAVSQSAAGTAMRAHDWLVGVDGTGSYVQSNGADVIDETLGTDSRLTLGVNAGGNGTYMLSGGTLSITSARGDGGLVVGLDGHGEFDLQGGSVDAATDVGVGNTGTGLLDQTGGSLTLESGQSLFLGRNAAGVGTFHLHAGTASLLVKSGNLQVGFVGAGHFMQDGGTVTLPASANAGYVFLGNFESASGDYTINSGSLTANAVFVGGDASGPGGTGSLTANGGTVTTSLAVYDHGTVNVSGGTINCGATASDNIRNDGVINVTSGALHLGGRFYGIGVVHQTNGASTFADLSNVQTGTVQVGGGTSTGNGSLLVGTTDANGTGNGHLTIEGGTTTINGVLGVGSDGTLTDGTGTGTIDATDGTLNAQTIILGSSAGGTGTMNVSAHGQIVVGGGLSMDDATISGGSLTVLRQTPPAGEDPVLWRSMVGGYLRDGALHVHGGAVVSPAMKLGISSGHSGTFDMDSGTVTVDTLGVGSDATLTGGQGTGTVTISGGTLNATTVILGSTAGGVGTMNVSGHGQIVVGGGLTANDLIMNGGTLTVKDTIPPASEDPVLNRSLVAGYLHDGALVMNAGTVTTPNLKIGVTPGRVGTLTMNGGTLAAGQLSAPNGTGSVIAFNNGTLRSGQSNVSTNSTLTIGDGTNAARLDLYPAGGTHTFAQGASVARNAQLTGAGTIVGNVENRGTVSPGSVTGEFGTLAVNGRYDQIMSGSTLAVEIGPQPGNDALVVSGEASIRGRLNVTRVGGTTPTIGHPFTVLVGHPVTGTFTAVMGAGVAVSYTDTSVVVTFTGVDVPEPPTGPATPLALALEPVQPNPQHGAGAITFDLPRDASVRVAIVDASGRLVRTVAAGEFAAGRHAVAWDGRSESGATVRPGVYLVRLDALGRRLSRKLIVE